MNESSKKGDRKIQPDSTSKNISISIHRAIKKRKMFIQALKVENHVNDQKLIGTYSVKELALFGIVILFFICALPRIVLNCYEMVSLKLIKENYHNDCFR